MNSVRIGNSVIGDGSFCIIAGPCAIESEALLYETARFLKQNGIQMMRGGIYKSRTSPSAFQGLREAVFEWLPTAKKETGLSLVTEVTDPRQIPKLEALVDSYVVGTRNMFNYELLKELALTKKPVILKRGMSAYVEEWLLAADYLIKGGNENVILCERGIRTFETVSRNTLDLSAVAYLKDKTKFPVLVDPSHAAGDAALVIPLSKAAKAVGADGLLIEVHPRPSEALCDGIQSLDFQNLTQLLIELQKISR